jgi:hypothetical protein
MALIKCLRNVNKTVSWVEYTRDGREVKTARIRFNAGDYIDSLRIENQVGYNQTGEFALDAHKWFNELIDLGLAESAEADPQRPPRPS